MSTALSGATLILDTTWSSVVIAVVYEVNASSGSVSSGVEIKSSSYAGQYVCEGSLVETEAFPNVDVPLTAF